MSSSSTQPQGGTFRREPGRGTNQAPAPGPNPRGAPESPGGICLDLLISHSISDLLCFTWHMVI